MFDGEHKTPEDDDLLDELEIFSDKKASNSMRLVYLQMLADADSSKLCKTSYNKLARALNIHRLTAVNAVNKLITLGYVDKIIQNADDGAHIDNIYFIKK